MYNATIDNTFNQPFGRSQRGGTQRRFTRAKKNSLVALMSAIGFLRNRRGSSNTTASIESPSRAFARPQQQARQARVQESDCVRSAN